MDDHSDANNGIIVHKSLKEADRNELVDELKDKLITDAVTGDTDPSIFDNGSQDVVNHNVENDEHLHINQDSNRNPSIENLTNQQAIGTESNAEVSIDLVNSNAPKVGEILENNKNSRIDNDITANEESSTSRNPSIDSSTSAREGIYNVKWVEHNSGQCAIITQNINGPCPLLAIVNVLLLRGKLTLPQGCEVISAEQLLEFLADLLISLSPGSNNPLPDFQHNINDAIAILPKLQTGLDVNVRFTGVKDFEYTPECIIFDLLGISLYHGWLVDPQLEETVLAVSNLTYNQLVENIITNSSSSDSAKMSSSIVAQQFLEESASQLTYHGLCELNSAMQDGQLAIFFRNNHFSTMYKQSASLYLLVTDQGFLNQQSVVWETLQTVEGDTVFVDHKLNPLQPEGPDQDHLIAAALQKQNETRCQQDREWQSYKESQLGNTEGLSDSELAARLQEVENAAVQGESQPQRPTIGPRKRDKKCSLM